MADKVECGSLGDLRNKISNDHAAFFNLIEKAAVGEVTKTVPSAVRRETDWKERERTHTYEFKSEEDRAKVVARLKELGPPFALIELVKAS